MLRTYISIFAAVVAAALCLGASTAHAGIVIIDGRGNNSLRDKTTSEPDGGRPLTFDEQQIYIWATNLFYGHAALAEGDSEDLILGEAPTNSGARDLEITDAEPTGCNAGHASAFSAFAMSLLLLLRRRRG